MFPTIMPGLRDLRSALIAGSLLVGSLYILLGASGVTIGSVGAELEAIVSLNVIMPTVIAVVACTLVGSLYTTALEGIVDWLHRKMLTVDVTNVTNPVARYLVTLSMPFSVSSRARLIRKAERYYDKHATTATQLSRDTFRDRVLADVLWLEGKLVGTSLKEPHDQYRSEGEIRVSTGLLIPLVAAALICGLHGSVTWLCIALAVGVGLAWWQVDYGLYYYRRANSFLAHHIADGTLLTPTMVSLK